MNGFNFFVTNKYNAVCLQRLKYDVGNLVKSAHLTFLHEYFVSCMSFTFISIDEKN